MIRINSHVYNLNIHFLTYSPDNRPCHQRPITNQHTAPVFWTEHYVIAHAPAYPLSEHITTASVALKNCSGTPEAPSIHSQTAGLTHREWSGTASSGSAHLHGLVQYPGLGSPELTGDQRGITPTAAPPLWMRPGRCTANIRPHRAAWTDISFL